MIDIPAKSILNAIEAGDIESQRDDGVIVVFLDLKPILTIPESPPIQVKKTVGNVVQVLSSDVVVATIQADSEAEAEETAATMSHLVEMA